MSLDTQKIADSAQQEVAGIIASERVDRDGEVFNYDASKPFIQKWSQNILDATSKTAAPGEESLGNLRRMHPQKGIIAVGKFTKIVFDDAAKTVWGVAKITDPETWDLVRKGVLSAFSVAGKLVSAMMKAGKRWITVEPLEVSIVDYPANPDSTLQWAKGCGIELTIAKFSEAFAPNADPGKNEIPINPNDQVKKVSPPGWKDTVEAMKGHSEIDNPWALAWWMDGEGYTPSHEAAKASQSLCSVAKASGLAWVGAVALASGFDVAV